MMLKSRYPALFTLHQQVSMMSRQWIKFHTKEVVTAYLTEDRMILNDVTELINWNTISFFGQGISSIFKVVKNGN